MVISCATFKCIFLHSKTGAHIQILNSQYVIKSLCVIIIYCAHKTGKARKKYANLISYYILWVWKFSYIPVIKAQTCFAHKEAYPEEKI